MFHKRLTPSQWIIVGVLGVVVFCVILIGFSFLSAAVATRQDVSRIEPQIARLKGLIEAEDQISMAARSAKRELSELIYAASGDPSAEGNNMQQSMRQLFERAGVEVSGSQVMPALEEEGLVRIRVRLIAKSRMEPLVDLLASLESHRPLVVIDTVDLAPERRRNEDDQELDVSIVLSSFVMLQG
ncbi:type II secretion system protein GspM [Gilvimarinus sp. HB14]|uniref:Type II secretion system protein GspM n=2 Tax=Gilvimarinus xylanilyticus TaxID=2944139 RepID=A0A9X2I2Y6_9GAMM|nr:type II secretion system protein GspM [Gilvimarinus xylanilyticus]MCP8899360.1 type II secretion system protein GspM [Gilvimarinus xylanilyticus]